MRRMRGRTAHYQHDERVLVEQNWACMEDEILAVTRRADQICCCNVEQVASAAAKRGASRSHD